MESQILPLPAHNHPLIHHTLGRDNANNLDFSRSIQIRFDFQGQLGVLPVVDDFDNPAIDAIDVDDALRGRYITELDKDPILITVDLDRFGQVILKVLTYAGSNQSGWGIGGKDYFR